MSVMSLGHLDQINRIRIHQEILLKYRDGVEQLLRGEFMCENGDFTTGALLCFRKAMNHFETMEKKEDVIKRMLFSNEGQMVVSIVAAQDRARCWNNIGIVLREQGKLLEAMDACHRALKIIQQLPKTTIPNNTEAETGDDEARNRQSLLTPTCWSSIGAVLAKQGYFREAMQYHQRALNTMKKQHEKKKQQSNECDMSLVNCWISMGVTYQYQEMYMEALELFQQAQGEIKRGLLLFQQEESSGMEGQEISRATIATAPIATMMVWVDCLVNMGDCGVEMKRLEEAMRNFQMAETILETRKPNSTAYGHCLERLADINMMLSNIQIGEDYHRRASTARTKAYQHQNGNNHAKRNSHSNQFGMGLGNIPHTSYHGPKPAVSTRTSRFRPNYGPKQSQLIPQEFDDKYKLGAVLSSGAFAEVFIAQHKQTKVNYAVKRVDRSKSDSARISMIDSEAANLRLLRGSQCVVALEEAFGFNNKTGYCYMVLEYMHGGNLLDQLVKKQSYSENETRAVLRNVLLAVKHMHYKRIAHRDIQPENLLLPDPSSATNVKVSDFGFSKRIVDGQGLKTRVGSPGYIAPEILERWPAYDEKCDLWSVGVILYELLGGVVPFAHEDPNKSFDLTRNGQYFFYPEQFGNVSNSAKHLVASFLKVRPQKRLTAAMALDHEWMKEADQILQTRTLSMERLRAIRKIKAAVGALQVANRVNKLDGDFHKYMEERKRKRLDTIANNNEADDKAPPEDSLSGKPFEDFYNVGKLLGEGGYAKVFLATYKKTGYKYAAKKIDMVQLQAVAGDNGYSTLQEEIHALKLLRGGPYILRLYDVFQNPKNTIMILELMEGGDLLQRIVDKEVYTEREARQTCQIMFEAIGYMHNKNIAHRDIKPENILLVKEESDTTIKIADFGFAKKVTRPNCLKTCCGTPEYVAPEILKGRPYDHRVDMWSCGVVMFVLLGGYAPFEGDDWTDFAPLIMEGDYEFHEDRWGTISQDAIRLVSSLMEVDPNLRLSADQALKAEWFSAEEELLSVTDLSAAQSRIKNSLPAEKLKAAVQAIFVTNKLQPFGLSGLQEVDDSDSDSTEVEETKEQDSSSGKQFNELFDLGAEIEDETIAVVYEATHKQSKTEYVVKCVSNKNLLQGDAVALQDEISALRELGDCPLIAKLRDVFHEPDNTYIVVEMLRGGHLLNRLAQKAVYTEADARVVFKNLLMAVQHCHERRIAVRRLTAQNIMLVSEESDTDIKLTDFGIAKKVLFENGLKTQCGDVFYVAPEILSHNPSYDVPCDMWSLGVILYLILGGYRPFRGKSDDEILSKVRYGTYRFHDQYWGDISPEAKNLIRHMLLVDPRERITAVDALECLWISADDSVLCPDLRASQGDELQALSGKEKLRQAVKAIVASHKLQSLGRRQRDFMDF